MQVFVFGVDSGQSAKHSKFLPSSSELITEIHPCLAMGPTAIGEVVVDTLDTPPHPPCPWSKARPPESPSS